jgi:hypothetical protein
MLIAQRSWASGPRGTLPLEEEEKLGTRGEYWSAQPELKEADEMTAKFPFAKYFGEVNILAALQFLPDEKPYFDRPPADPEQKDLLLYLGCYVLRTAHLAKTAIEVLKAMGFDFNAVGRRTAVELCTT